MDATELASDVEGGASDDELPGGRHSEAGPGLGKGAWLASAGVGPQDLAGKVVTISAYKGGVGKTLLAYELAYLLGAVLVDLDWDWGNASRAWGYREETRKSSTLLDALERRRVPRPITGGPWRPDLVPCSSDFGSAQPGTEALTEALTRWAGEWGQELGSPVVIDTHPGGGSSTFAAAAVANIVVAPVVLAEREMEGTEGMVEELKGYPLLLTPNKVPMSPPERYISWLDRIAKAGAVPVGPAVSDYRWLGTRSRRMAVCASDPVPARARKLVDELQSVAGRVVADVLAG